MCVGVCFRCRIFALDEGINAKQNTIAAEESLGPRRNRQSKSKVAGLAYSGAKRDNFNRGGPTNFFFMYTMLSNTVSKLMLQ